MIFLALIMSLIICDNNVLKKNTFEILIALVLCVLTWSPSAQTANEVLSVSVEISGDIQGKYDLSGPLGKNLNSQSSSDNSKCEIQGLLRKVTRSGSVDVELWLTLICMFEGQKNTFKLHRIYLDPTKKQQIQKFTYLSKNIRQIEVKFQDLSLKMRK